MAQVPVSSLLLPQAVAEYAIAISHLVPTHPLRGEPPHSLADVVNNYLRDGFRLYGAPFSDPDSGCWCQIVVRMQEDSGGET